MASLNPQVWIADNQSYFLLSDNIEYNTPASFNSQSGTSLVLSVDASNSQLIFENAQGVPANIITQSDTATTFQIGTGNTTAMVVTQAQTSINGTLNIEDFPTSNAYMSLTAPSLNTPGSIVNHAEVVPNGVQSSISFLTQGVIQTSDKLYVGTTSAATLQVGASDSATVVGPDRFSFTQSGAVTGGLFLQGSTVNLGQGADPLNTGLGITVGPSTIGFRKTLDAKDGVSINANGNIISTATANNVGGNLTLNNGNYSLVMQATGDGFAPSGVGGTITSFNAGVVCPTVLNTGKNSSITGASDGVMNITSTSTINLNAPTVLINGLSPLDVYVWNFEVSVPGSPTNVNGNPTLGDGAWCPWGIIRIAPSTFGSCLSSPSPPPAPQNAFWTCPLAGLYSVSINIRGQPTNIGGGNDLVLLQFFANASPLELIGTILSPYQYTASPQTFTMTTYVVMALNDKLSVQGGQNGGVDVYGDSSWVIKFISLN